MARGVKSAKDGHDRDRVGRRHDAPEQQRARQRQLEHEHQEAGDQERSEDGPGQRQHQHRSRDLAYLLPVEPKRGFEQQRRQEHEQQEVRAEAGYGDPVGRGGEDAAEDEQRGVRDAQVNRQETQERGAEQQPRQQANDVLGVRRAQDASMVNGCANRAAGLVMRLLVGCHTAAHARRSSRPVLWLSPWVGYAAALGAVALVSVFIGLVLGQVNLANASMLYLLAVMATAVAFGRGPAVFASIAAFLVFDWFFVEPLHQFTVSDPEEWVSLLFFLLTATVTGQLAAGSAPASARGAAARARSRRAVRRGAPARRGRRRYGARGGRRAAAPRAASGRRWRSSCGARRARRAASVPVTARRCASCAGAARERRASCSAARTRSADEHAAPGRWVRIVQPTRASERRATTCTSCRCGSATAALVRCCSPTSRAHLPNPRIGCCRPRRPRSAWPSNATGCTRKRPRPRSCAAPTSCAPRLLNAVSHDLRTPLATIMASAGSLRQHDVAWTEEEREGFAQAIEEEADHLNHLVGNLLDISRIEGGSLKPQMSWHDLGSLIDDVVDRLRPVTRAHRVQVDGARRSAGRVARPGRDRRGAATTWSKTRPSTRRPDTEIAIDARRDGGVVRVQVSDRGPGHPAAALPHLFDPFYRVIDGKPRPQGLGLGLAIVKGLVEAHGGRVWAENRAGAGARFTFTLPLSEAVPDLQPAPDAAHA